MKQFTGHHQQRGAATLLVALILLFAITMVTVFSARNQVTETTIASNDYRAKQAHEAAMAGLEVAALPLTGSTMRSTLQTDADNDGYYDNNGVYAAAVTLPNGSDYQVAYSNIVQGDFSLVEVTVKGRSDDDVATSTVRQTIQLFKPMSNPPTAGMVAGGNVGIRGSSQINNTANPSSTETTVLSAGNAMAAMPVGSRPLRGKCTGASSGFTNSQTSTTGATGVDDNNIALKKLTAGGSSDSFFENFFGMSRSEVQSFATEVTCPTNCTKALDDAAITNGAQIIYVKGDLTINSVKTYGTADKPVLLIVEGTVDIQGNPDFNGLIYATGTNTTSGISGNPDFNGAFISEGDFVSTGNICIDYRPDILANLNNAGGPVAKVNHTWRDF